jgi:hypothetical protein
MKYTWLLIGDRSWTFGPYRTSLTYEGSRYPWQIFYKDKPLLREHGNCTGFRRFGSLAAAKKWVESRKGAIA